MLGKIGHSRGYNSKRITPFIFHYILFALAFIFGVLTVKFNYIYSDISLFSAALSKTVNSSYLYNLISFALINTVIAAVYCLFGYFTFGAALNILMFLLFGLGNGALFALICRLCGGVGVAVNLTVTLIPTVLLLIIYIIISTASSYFSTGLAVAVFSNRSLIGIKNRMNDMLVIFALSVPCIFAVSAIRALFIMIFSGVFFA